MSSSIGWATLQVIPVIEGISSKVSNDIGAPLTAAGKKAGQDTGKEVADGIAASKAAVEKAAATLASAQNKAADAADKVGVAEAKLQALYDRGVTDAGRLAAARAAVAKANRDSEAAANKAGTAAAQLTRAEEAAANAAKNLGSQSSSASGGVKELGENTDKAEGSLSRFGKLAAAGAGLAYLGGKAVEAGKSFLDIGETFANVNKTLTFTTGATGEALESMTESVKNIGKGSPKAFGEIADVLAKVSQRTNLTGKDLEDVTKKVMKVSTVMGQDTDINTLTSAFAAFGLSGKDASSALDQLFKASRATGVSVNELAAQAVKGAPQFQQFGLSIGETAALMGSLDKAGINSDAVMMGLNKAMLNFAKAGRAPKEALNETIKSIQDFTKAGNDSAATELATKVFGAKGAGQFVNAVKSGAIGIEGLTAALDENQQGVMEAGGAIPTLSSAWALFKNNVIIALEPIATRVFGIFIEGLTWFRTTGVQAIQAVVGAFEGFLNGGILDGIGNAFTFVKDSLGSLWEFIATGNINETMASLFDFNMPLLGRIEDLRLGVIDAFNEIKGGITAFVAAFKDGSDDITSSGFAGFLERLGVIARDLYDTWNETILPALRSVGDFALDVGAAALPILWGAFETGVNLVVGVGEALGKVIGWMVENRDIVLTVAGVITALFLPALASMAAALITQGIAWLTTTIAVNGYVIAMGVYNTVMKVATAGTKIFAAAQTVLKAAFIGNPIGLLIAGLVALGAGLVLAYKKSETFRNIIQGAWTGIKTAFSTAWDVIKVVFDKIGDAVGWIVSFIRDHWKLILPIVMGPLGLIIVLVTTFWDQIKTVFKVAIAVVLTAAFLMWDRIKGVFTLIGDIAMLVWNTLLRPAFDLMKAGLQVLGDFFGWVWNSLIKPAWDGLGAGISWVWQNIIRPAWDGLKAALQAVGDFFGWVWNTLIKPAWDGLGAGISWVWENVIRPAWDGLKAALQAVGDFFRWIWESVIKPAWDGLAGGISWVVDNIIQPAWDRFTRGLGKIKDFFVEVVKGIGDKWDSLKGILAKPINFMINTVWNDGILKAWNKAAGLLGLGQAQPLEGIPEHATGGAIRGPGSGTSDDVLMWGSNGEHMFTAMEVIRAGGHNAIYAIRDMISRGIPFSWDGGRLVRDIGRDNLNAYGAKVARDGYGNVDPQGMFDKLLPAYKDGGEIRPMWQSQLENGHRAAKMRNGNPYTWGFEDCSGYMSMIADAIINGGNGVRRWATSSFPGGQPWDSGLGEGFSVGVWDDPGGPGGGHTAGTMTGVGGYSTVNVESSGSGGVMYGGGAIGADSSYFAGKSPGLFHLAIGADGAFESAGGPSPERKKSWLNQKISDTFDFFLNPIKGMFASAIGTPPPDVLGIPPSFLNKGRDGASKFLSDAVENLGSLLGSVWNKAKSGFGLFRDQGGWIPNGLSIVRNETGKPEAVLNWEQIMALRDLFEAGDYTGALSRIGIEEDHPFIGAVLNARSALGLPSLSPVAEMAEAAPIVSDPGSAKQSASKGSDGGSEKTFSARDRWDRMFTDIGGAVGDGAAEIFGLNEWFDLADRYTIKDSNAAAAPSLAAGEAAVDNGGSAALSEAADVVRTGADLYAYEIARAARELDLGAAAAVIGEATALVESGDPLKMWANNAVPESLNYPHDAVGSDHDSVGLFQQRDNGAWGTVEQRMSPFDSATMFFKQLPEGWQSMDPGAAAQAVQRSGFPDRYGQMVGRARELVNATGLFDTGGWLMPGQFGFNGLNEPEPVLKNAHWKIAEANIGKVDELVGSGVGGPQTAINQTFNVTVADQAGFHRQANRDRDLAMMQFGGRPF